MSPEPIFLSHVCRHARVTANVGYLTTLAALVAGIALVATGYAAYGWALVLTAPVILYLLSSRPHRR